MMIYINSEKSISVYNGTAVYPVPSITLDKSSDGGFNFLMGFQLSTNISSLSSSSFKLFGSPYLSTIHGVHDIYDYTARSTSFQITPKTFDEVNRRLGHELDFHVDSHLAHDEFYIKAKKVS